MGRWPYSLPCPPYNAHEAHVAYSLPVQLTQHDVPGPIDPNRWVLEELHTNVDRFRIVRGVA